MEVKRKLIKKTKKNLSKPMLTFQTCNLSEPCLKKIEINLSIPQSEYDIKIKNILSLTNNKIEIN